VGLWTTSDRSPCTSQSVQLRMGIVTFVTVGMIIEARSATTHRDQVFKISNGVFLKRCCELITACLLLEQLESSLM
jgi:hypothetical protein